MTRIRKAATLEKLYPKAAARAAADAAVDALDPATTTLAQAVDVWDEAYHRATGRSPFREEEP